MKQPARPAFKPRVLPRNGNDWTLSLLASPFLIVSVVILLLITMGGLAGLVYLASGDSFLAVVTYLLASLAWMAWGMLLPVQRLEFSEAGIHIVRPCGTRIVLWEEIERVEQLSPAEFLRATANPQFYTGKMACPGSFSYADYVLIHHKGGSILFPPQNKKAFLDQLRKHWTHKGASRNQEAATETPWHSTTPTLREESPQTLRSRRGG
jgi:hypothetical protein